MSKDERYTTKTIGDQTLKWDNELGGPVVETEPETEAKPASKLKRKPQASKNQTKTAEPETASETAA